jgi:ketosteroid isomerase-like protein
MKTTQDVLTGHLNRFLAGDLEGMLSDYHPQAVMFTRQGPLRGPEAIRPLFQGLIGEFSEPGAIFRLDYQAVDGEHAYILWHGETAAQAYENATDTFVVRGGRIVAQSFTAQVRARA